MKRKIAFLLATILCAWTLLAAASPPKAEDIFLFERNGKFGYMDRSGNTVIRPKYVKAGQFHEGLASVIKTFAKGTGYIDSTGKYIIPDGKYYGINPFQNGVAVVDLDYGGIHKLIPHMIIDQSGKPTVDRMFREHLADSREGRIAYSSLPTGMAPHPDYVREIEQSYLNTVGEPATTRIFDRTESFSEGFAAVGHWRDGDIYFVADDMKFGLINTDFELVVDYQFDDMGVHKDGLVPVQKGGEWGYIDTQGNIVIDFQFDSINPYDDMLSYNSLFCEYPRKSDLEFSDGVAGVCKDGKWGYIDKQGNTVIPMQYECARPFSEGLAAVRQDGKWGFINRKGEMLIEPKYDRVLDCKRGMIVVSDQDNNYKFYLNKTGKVIRNLG